MGLGFRAYGFWVWGLGYKVKVLSGNLGEC